MTASVKTIEFLSVVLRSLRVLALNTGQFGNPGLIEMIPTELAILSSGQATCQSCLASKTFSDVVDGLVFKNCGKQTDVYPLRIYNSQDDVCENALGIKAQTVDGTRTDFIYLGSVFSTSYDKSIKVQMQLF